MPEPHREEERGGFHFLLVGDMRETGRITDIVEGLFTNLNIELVQRSPLKLRNYRGSRE